MKVLSEVTDLPLSCKSAAERMASVLLEEDQEEEQNETGSLTEKAYYSLSGESCGEKSAEKDEIIRQITVHSVTSNTLRDAHKI